MEKLNSLKEVTDLLNTSGPLNDEFYRSIVSLQETFQNSYVRKLYSIAGSEEEKVKAQPSKEVVLLKALKGFSNKGSFKQIDNAIEVLNLFNTAQNLQSQLKEVGGEKGIMLMENNEKKLEQEKSTNIASILLMLALMKKL